MTSSRPPARCLARRACAAVSRASLQFSTACPAVTMRNAASLHIGDCSGIAVIHDPRVSSGNGCQGSSSITRRTPLACSRSRNARDGYRGISTRVRSGNRVSTDRSM